MNDGTDQSENLVDVMSVHQTVLEKHQEGTGSSGASADDWHLIGLLRGGDETAFVSLIDSYYSAMLPLALVYVATRAVAEEVVQETWVAVLEGLHRFEGRSSLKTWIFRILTNRAKTRAQREGRSIPFSSIADMNVDDAEPAVDPDRFRPAGTQWAGGWKSFPATWEELPEERVLSQETRNCIEKAIATLPPNQREIIILRDIEGWSAEETCHALNISEGNQRVLLHRARSKVRGVLEKYFTEV
jgi:RNA polymerase sigma-70 factor (ECF subfamily)